MAGLKMDKEITMYFADEPEHIRLLRDSMRRFAEREMPPEAVRRWEREATSPPELFAKLAETGVCGLTVPEEFGGAGRDIVAAVAVIDELSQHGTAAAGPYIHCAFYGGLNISENGSDTQKQELLPKLARGEILMAYGLSEPNVGGDLPAVETTGRLSRDGQSVTINGTKRWCTAARIADYIICLLRSDAEAPRYKNLSLVLVPTAAAGISMTDLEHQGLRYTDTCDVNFDGVEVPINNVLGGPEGWNRGWSVLAGPALDVEKLEITAVALGVATAALEDAWNYAQERRQFGQPICAHQSVRHALVEARTKLAACRHMLYHAAWLADQNRPCSVETSMAKLYVADTAVDIVIECQRVMGAYGCSGEFDMERHLRDITLMPIVGGSSRMQKNNIANRLGLPD
ncbi:MAG TPA: acyl-CoA dehydrogenase family protein [Alphaproteobacteria bacterium]|nr:acyl-CoA dehydrogenase family protein [Alphaproteobacteria bacterium]